MLWSGDLGGAEAVNVMLAREWRRWGAGVTFVFVTRGGPLEELLDRDRIPHVAAGLERGRSGALHPRRLARVLSAAGRDGALLVDSGYLAAALRAGGYTGRLVGAEHGKVLATGGLPRLRRLGDRVERWCGARCRSADVGVSDFLLDELRRHPHAPVLRRIHNGVDAARFAPAEDRGASGALCVAAAARLVPGKGIDRLLGAVAELRHLPLRLEIAGDGPERESLTRLAAELRLDGAVTFRAGVDDMPRFWRSCDVAVVPSDTFVESFSMATLEAMACGVPVVATRNGGIPEVLGDGEAGTIVPPGDPAALAAAIRGYATDPDLRVRHGAAGRARAERHFAIATAAAAYLDLLAAGRP